MDGNLLIGKIQSAVYAIRRGQTNQVLAFFTVGLMAAGEYLRRQWKQVPWLFSAVLYALSALCLVWLVWRLWKLAATPPEVSDKPVPTAIKGLLPWSIVDGRLFARLGRRSELELLLGLAQNDQIPVVVVRGESGCGKTSLLQAGLRYSLGADSCVYWEALSSDAPGALLYAINSTFPQIQSLDSIPGSPTNRWVLILDQFEQLHSSRAEHLPIFRLLARTAKAPAPHKISVVIGFRREYVADWLDFEQESHFRAEQVPVNLLPRNVAADVMATIANQAGFSLEQQLVDNFLSAVSQPRGISPLDISIGLESLANFARQRDRGDITVRDYQLVGEAEGLLQVFVQEKLEEVPEAIRMSLLKGIVLSLIDLGTNQRVATGETAAAIAAKAELPDSQLRPWLDRLALPRLRLLERVGVDRYRLPHERLVPVLWRLSGTELALLDQRRMLFETDYQRWKQTRSRRHLLAGKDLTEVLAVKDQLFRGDDAGLRAEYLDACIGRRRMLRLLGAVAAAGLVDAGYGAYWFQDRTLQKRALANWQLPPDLFTQQHHIDGLDLTQTINELGWLRSRKIRNFSCLFRGNVAAEFERLMGLTRLGIAESEQYVAQLKLPRNLDSLSMSTFGWEFNSFAQLRWPPHLTSLELKLDVSEKFSLTHLQLPAQLTSLKLDLSGVESLKLSDLNWPPHLNSLTLKLDLGLESPKLSDLNLPPYLNSLTLEGEIPVENLADLQFPPTLKALELNCKGDEFVKLFDLKLLNQVSALSLHLAGIREFSPGSDVRWPQHLTSLSLQNLGGSVDLSRARLPETLKSFGIAYAHLVSSNIELPRSITSLFVDMSYLEGQIANFRLPDHVKNVSLRFFLSKMKSLSGIEWPGNMTELSLDLGSEFEDVGELKQLKNLKALNLEIRPPLLPNIARLSLGSITTMWVVMEGTHIPKLPTDFKFLGLRI